MRSFIVAFLFVMGSASAAAPISSSALSNYTKEQYPKAFAVWGEAGIERIKKLERIAVHKASESNKCDSVAYAGLSEKRSTPTKNAVVFADCENGERFYVSEDSIPSDAIAQSDAALSNEKAIELCKSMVLERAKYPSTVDFEVFGASASSNKTTGNSVVTIGYKAKNDMGSIVPMNARCVLSMNGPPEVELTIK